MAKIAEEILKLFHEGPGHMTAEEVFLLAKNSGIRVSVASVYRVLSKLSAEGKLRKVPNPDGADIFDITTRQHGHLICSGCGKASDLWIPGLQEKIEREAGIKAETVDLTVRYVCPECLQKSI